jgi:hypothetical protein
MTVPLDNLVLRVLTPEAEDLDWLILADGLDDMGDPACEKIRELVRYHELARKVEFLPAYSDTRRAASTLSTNRLVCCAAIRFCPARLMDPSPVKDTVWMHTSAGNKTAIAMTELFVVAPKLLSDGRRRNWRNQSSAPLPSFPSYNAQLATFARDFLLDGRLRFDRYNRLLTHLNVLFQSILASHTVGWPVGSVVLRYLWELQRILGLETKLQELLFQLP